MMSRLVPPVLSLLLAAASCARPAERPAPAPAAAPTAGQPRGQPTVRVIVLGDMPYTPAMVPGYRRLLATIDDTPADFVVHIGDLTSRDCSDALYEERLREFQAVAHPLVYTPGDNEWTDCARDGRDPLERLQRLRALFAPAGTSLGRRTMPVERQSAADPRFAAYPENARWRAGGVLFVALHVVGSNNNRGREAAPAPEYAARNEANLAWLREAFATAAREGSRGIAIFMQANPGLLGGFVVPDTMLVAGFRETTSELRRLTLEFGKPVALVHGDSHTFRVDKPFRDPRTEPPLVLTNFTRAETFGSPDTHGLLMVVDPTDPGLFRFAPLLAREGAAR